MKTVKVTFDEKGNATIETSGYSGGECMSETAELEAALGKKINTKKKAEYYVETNDARLKGRK